MDKSSVSGSKVYKESEIYSGANIYRFNDLKKLLIEGKKLFKCSIDLGKQLLTNKDFQSISQYEYSVTGNFNCNDNKLTSLEGSPKKVGSFYCSRNQLTSLKGSPINVRLDFWCNNNKLDSFIGAPEKIGGVFNFSSNKFISLEGLPENIKGDIYLFNNPIGILKRLNTLNFYQLGNNIYYGKVSTEMDQNFDFLVDKDINCTIRKGNETQDIINQYIKTYNMFITSTIKISDNLNKNNLIEINGKKYNKKLIKL